MYMCIQPLILDSFSLVQVYKVLVRKTPDESWVVFRRYTDFSRLNDKVGLNMHSRNMNYVLPKDNCFFCLV